MVSLGRSVLPLSFFRIRALRFSRGVSCWATFVLLLASAPDQPAHEMAALGRASLAFLAPDLLLGVLDALPLVGLGQAQVTHLRGGEADEVLVDAAHGDARLLRVHVRGHALGERERDGVRVAEDEVQLLPLRLGLEADPVDLQRPLVPLHHALDGVLDQGAGEAVQPLRETSVVGARDLDLLADDLDLDLRVVREVHLPLRTLDLDVAVHDLDLHLVRDLDRKLADSGHGLSYQTVQMSSPPTFCLRASRSTITPLDVERMAMPRPFRIRGMESVGTYRRRPGRETRLMSLMAGSRSALYLKRIVIAPWAPSSCRT